MTGVSPSDDELISSYLDHETTTAEAARVEGDPRLMARVEEMRAAITFIATPPLLPDTDLDRIRASAVAAFRSTAPVSVTPVVDMAAARVKRLERRNRILVVAAAVLLFGGLIGGIASLGSGEDSDSAGDSIDSSSNDESFIESGDDAANFSATSESDDASDSSDDADTAEAASEMAADVDMASDGDEATDGTSNDAVAEDGRPASRLQKSSNFDPLPDNLGVYASVEELAITVETLVTEMTANEEVADVSAEFLAFTTCGEALALALAGDTTLDVDIAEAVLDTTPYTIVVGRHFESAVSVGRIAPSDTCSPITKLFVSP
ncbi:MAG: hypothetical protein P8L46_14215 [Acidimicrobiales bacterium]|nr:hypothetical protein [Acidimicrobiales bacterium]MDG2219189.1 hypothetical protein [Acidimicrobiales bacterium]